MAIYNITLSGDPHEGGLYTAVQDFQQALDATNIVFSAKEPIRPPFAKAPVWIPPLTGRLDRTGHRFSKKRIQEGNNKIGDNCRLLIAHGIFRAHNSFTYSIAKSRGIRYWAVPHGSMDPWVFSYNRINRWIKEAWLAAFGKRYFRAAAAVVCATRQEMKKMKERYEGDNFSVISWPLQPIAVDDHIEQRRLLREELGAGDDTKILFFLGRYHRMKRPAETIENFCRAGTSNTLLVMAGIDETYTANQLKEFAGSARNVRVIGPRFGEEKRRLLAGADGFISLSKRENFGYTAAEALSAGNAVILSPGNDLAPEVNQLGCGWMLESIDNNEVIKAIQAFDRASFEALHQMGERAKTWADWELDFERFQFRIRQLARDTTGLSDGELFSAESGKIGS